MGGGWQDVSTSIDGEGVDLKGPIMYLRQEICNLLSLLRGVRAEEPEEAAVIKFVANDRLVNKY